MSVKSALAFFAASLIAVSAFAEDEEESVAEKKADGASEEQPAEVAGVKGAKKKGKDEPKAQFTTLPLARKVEGDVEVRLPSGGEWKPVEEGRFYPLGSTYRTLHKGCFTLAFGINSFATIGPESMFGTRAEKLGSKARTVILMDGELLLDMPDNLPQDAFYVTSTNRVAPQDPFFMSTRSFTVCDLAGQSKYTISTKGGAERVTVRCVTGSLSIKGRHFEIPVMRAANEVEIREEWGKLFTFIRGKSGDVMVKLDKGERIKEEVGDDGQMHRSIEKCESEWKLSPSTKIVIRRAVPEIGKRMSVFIMCFDAAGVVKSQCAYCERRSEINSGEMIKKDKSKEEMAKRAAEAAATSDAAAETTEEAPAEEEKKGDEKKEEKKSDKEEDTEDGEL